MLATYFAAGAITAASVLIGAALLKLSSFPASGAHSGAVGFAACMALASGALRLPGDGRAAAVVLAVLAVGSAFYVRPDLPRPPRALIAALAVTVALGSLPYAANGRFGVIGVSVNNDPALHLVWTEYLRTGGEQGLVPAPGYPTGPHAVAAAMGTAPDWALMGMTLAVILLTTLAFWGVLEGLAPRRRALGSVAVAMVYTAAAYYAEASFKESVQILLLAGLLSCARDVWRRRQADPRALLPSGVLFAGLFYNYSYTGVAWPLATLIVAGAMALVVHRKELARDGVRASARGAVPDRAQLRRAGTAALVLVGAVALLLAPQLTRIPNFVRQLGTSPSGTGVIGATNLGNLPGPLSSLEAFGLWPRSDFRLAPSPAVLKYLLGGVGLVVSVWGSAWLLRRRNLLIPAAALASAVIYLVLEARESAYIAAKGLAILAPFAMLPSVAWMLHGRRSRVATVAISAFLGLALYSSLLALTGATVGPREPGDELAQLRPIVQGSSVLALVNDDFLRWDLRGTRKLTTLNYFTTVPEKPFSDGKATDLDSAPAGVVNRHRFVLTTNTSYASLPSPGLSPVARTRLFILWKRTGPVAPHRLLKEDQTPGARLDCRSPQGRALSRSTGFAVTRPQPWAVAVTGNRRFVGEDGRRLVLRLPAGSWRMSLQYTSPHPVDVTAGGLHTRMPAVLDRSGGYRAMGLVRHSRGGPLTLRLVVRDPSLLPAPTRAAEVSAVSAVRAEDRATVVRLRRACGRYVDWYTLGAARPAVPKRP